MVNKIFTSPLTLLLGVLLLLSSCSNKEKLVEKPQQKSRGSAFDLAFFEAQRAKAVGDEEKAYLGFRQCLEINPKSSVVHYELSRIEFLQNKTELAIESINQAVDLEEDNRWYRAARAEYLMNAGELEAALKDHIWVCDQDNATVDEFYALINNFIYLQKNQEAIATYTRMENRFGHSTETSLQKLDLLGKISDGSAVLEELNLLIEKSPKESLWMEKKVEVLQLMGRGDEAFALLEKLAEEKPNQGSLHLHLATFYERQGKHDKAIKSLELGLGSVDTDFRVKQDVLLSIFPPAYLKTSSKEEISNLLSILIEKHESEAAAHTLAGDYATRMGVYEEAQRHYFKALELDPSVYDLWMQLCSIDIELRDWVSLKAHSAETLLSFPNQAQSYLWKGIAEQQLNEHENAIKTLKSGEVLVFGDVILSAQFASALGESHHQLKNYDDSDKWFEKALSLNGNDPGVLNNYAYYLSLRKAHLDRAKEYGLRANELSPSNGTYEDTYAWVLFQRGEFEEAKKWIEQAVAHGGSQDGVVIEHYGDILFHLGETDEALKKWKEAQSLGNEDPTLNKKISDRTYYAE